MKLNGLRLALALALAGATMAGCVGHDETSDTAVEAEVGTIALALSAQTNGTTYRLRGAVFDVAGAGTGVLSSETDPDAAVLSATLPAGTYTITLRDGWYLERVSVGTSEPVQASLTSENGVSFFISPGLTTSVPFTFDTNGQVITIGPGQLEVSIQVNETNGSCDVLTQTGCAASERCYIADGSGAGACATPIALDAPGTACSAQTSCLAPGACLQVTPDEAVCAALCGLDGTGPQCPAGQTCFELGLGDLGVCD